MVRIRPLLSSVMAYALLSTLSFAEAADANSVKIRGSDKSGYSRVVLDFGALQAKVPAYSVQQTAKSLLITFQQEAMFQQDGPPLSSLGRVDGYKIAGKNSVEIDFPEGQNIRHFVVDNRLVIDIKGDAKKADTKKINDHADQKKAVTSAATSAPAPTPAPVNLAAKIETAAGEAPKEPPVKEVASEIQKAKEAIQKIADPKEHLVVDEEKSTSPEAKVEPKKIHDYAVTMSSTSSIPMAIFEKNNYLWVVQGKENIKIPPQITGEGAQALGGFQPVPARTVSAFRLPLPDGVTATVTGGGLVWKMKLSNGSLPKENPLPIQRMIEGEPSVIWPAESLQRITDIQDPETGAPIYIALVELAKDFTGGGYSFVDFDILPSLAGMAVTPKVDDLKLSKADPGVLISKAGGLKIANDKDIVNASSSKTHHVNAVSESLKESETDKEMTRIFDFKDWQVGTDRELATNQRLIMSAMSEQTEEKRAESLVNLARLMLSFNYAPETIGYLELAQASVPEIDTNPEFMSLMGAAQVLAYRPKEAYQNFSAAGLNDVGEIAYWKAYTLAKLDDWQQAADVLPEDVSVLEEYPGPIKFPVALTLSEVALRQGNIAKAKKIMDLLEPDQSEMPLPSISAFRYLSGELDRQLKKTDEAKNVWKELTTGDDDLYRAKARFALTMLQRESKDITDDKAIDNLEGLRYAWRGDDLEVAINYNLAKIYLEKNDPVKALTLMKLAHSLNPTSEQGKKIDQDMRDVFKNLFTAEKIKSVSPVDILAVYNEFSNLIPAGADGEALTRQLAERMASADLLPRAINILRKQLDSGIKGLDAADVAIRLAALQNTDSRPDEALKNLDKAELLLKDQPTAEVLSRQNDIGLLRAKSYSLKNKPDDAFAALALLPQDDKSLRLKADIAWRGKKWQDAADSLEQLVQNQNIVLTRPLNDEQAELLLNWAVALYLADNRYVLANLRERYSDAMAATTKAQKFEVVTRPRQGSLLADRDTINSIIDETTIFKDFLNSFKAGDVPTAASAAKSGNAASGEAAPAEVPEALRNVQGLKADEVLGD